MAFGAVTLTPPGMDSRLRGNDGGWRSARSPSPRRGWIPAFAGTTVVGVRRGHPRPAGDGFPPSRERRWLAFGAVTLTPPGMDSRLRGNDGGWRSARSPSPRRGWIPAFAGMTVVGVRRGHPRPAGDGFPPSRERRWLAFGAVTLTPPGMDSRLRGNDGYAKVCLRGNDGCGKVFVRGNDGSRSRLPPGRLGGWGFGVLGTPGPHTFVVARDGLLGVSRSSLRAPLSGRRDRRRFLLRPSGWTRRRSATTRSRFPRS